LHGRGIARRQGPASGAEAWPDARLNPCLFRRLQKIEMPARRIGTSVEIPANGLIPAGIRDQ
jgi:hypothetical protein